MADEDEVQLDQESSQEEITSAKKLGWSDKDKFRGDPERWVPAKEFLRRGEEMLPLIKSQKAALENQVAGLLQKDADRDRQMKALEAALNTIEEAQQQDLEADVKQAMDDIEEQIAVASEAGDHKGVAKLTRQLAELTAKKETVQPKGKTKVQETPSNENTPELQPEFVAWRAENEWFGKDKEKTNVALGLGMSVRASGFVGEAYYEELDKRLDQYYEKKGPRETKVGSGGRGGGGGGGGEDDASYASLPKEAKEACMRFANKVVGPNKKYKTVAEYQASYAKQLAALG